MRAWLSSSGLVESKAGFLKILSAILDCRGAIMAAVPSDSSVVRNLLQSLPIRELRWVPCNISLIPIAAAARHWDWNSFRERP